MAAVSTIVFFPEGAYGPTNNCVGIGQVLQERGHRVVFVVEESFAGTLEAQGFEERHVRLAPPPETEEVPGQFWKDFIRDTAPVFRTADDRAARGVHRADLPRALRRGAVRRRPPARDLRRARARRDRRGQRRRVPGRRALRPPVGAHRLLQPARAEGRRDRRPSSPAYPLDDRAGWDEFRVDYLARTRPAARGVQRLLRGARRAAAARGRPDPRIAAPEPLRVPGRARLPARNSARPDLAPPRHVRSPTSTRSPAGPTTARSSTSRSARSARPTSS